MTDEELRRMRLYVVKIEAADGDLSALTYDECLDLETLVRKRLRDGEAEERLNFEKEPFNLGQGIESAIIVFYAGVPCLF